MRLRTLALALSLVACENLPGTRTEQATVLGGLAGGAAGAALNDENRVLGAIVGGALGAGAGYVIGARTDWFGNPRARDEASDAIRSASTSPATVEDVRRASTADVNDDGFVTIDEVVAQERAGLSDEEQLRRLRATGQVFDLTDAQREALRDEGVSDRVVDAMGDINRDQRDRILSRPSV
jgi:hypothetical protein